MLEILELHYCIIIRSCALCRPLAHTGQVLQNGWLHSKQEKKNQTILDSILCTYGREVVYKIPILFYITICFRFSCQAFTIVVYN